jgi:hypothetical protein
VRATAALREVLLSCACKLIKSVNLNFSCCVVTVMLYPLSSLCSSIDGAWGACLSAYEMIANSGARGKERGWADALLVIGAANSMNIEVSFSSSPPLPSHSLSRQSLDAAFATTGMCSEHLFPMIQAFFPPHHCFASVLPTFSVVACTLAGGRSAK